LANPAFPNVGDDEIPASLPPIALGGPAVSIAAGAQHVCAILANGEVRCWGRNSAGQLGYGQRSAIGDNETPEVAGSVQLGGSALQLVLGTAHTCALLSDRTVRCFGSNTNQLLGYVGPAIGDDEVAAFAPALTFEAPVLALAAGNAHTCALLENGSVRCWGRNQYGQLGLATSAASLDITSNPAPVELGGPAVKIAAGGNTSCAVLASGELVCWGQAASGSLGLGRITNVGDDETPASVGPVPLF
jgi:alpha-tubulin suppressor-like RCC1 family protein